MNVVFICVDCLREDFLRSNRGSTPFLDEFVSESVYFSNMFSTTTTTPCVASFMTGCYSERNGVNTHSEVDLRQEVDTLAGVFRDAGYNTHAMATGPLVEKTGLDRGFDEYRYRERNEHLYDSWGKTARSQIEGLEEPFFLYLHLWELHDPIQVPEKYDDPDNGRYPYMRALSALDRELEDVIGRLPEDTLIALHGDHGESITWRGSLFRGAIRRVLREKLRYEYGLDVRSVERRFNRLAATFGTHEVPDHFMEDGHGENVFDFTTNVPFAVHHPDIEPADVDAQVRQVDVFPTILDAAGVEYEPETTIDGMSLLPPATVEDRDAYIRACGKALRGRENWMRAIRHDGWKYVEYPNSNRSSELYDVREDPRELTPVVDSDRSSSLRERLPDDELHDVDDIGIDDLLQDLGYL